MRDFTAHNLTVREELKAEARLEAELLSREESLIDYDDIDWQDEIDRKTCGYPPLFRDHTIVADDCIPF